MPDPDELRQAAARDGAPQGADRETLIAWYESRAAAYARAAADDPQDASEPEQLAWNARAMARNLRRSRAE